MARPIAENHEAKRLQILKAAAKVFAEQGFGRASMSLLAKECGVSKANIYHYYDGKDALLFDILNTHLRKLRDRIYALELSELPPEDRLRHTLREILFAYEGADNEHRVQICDLTALAEAQQKLLRGYQLDLVHFVSDILAKLSPDTFVNAPDKLRASTMSAFAMLNWYYMWNADSGPQEREAYARMISTMIIHGLPNI